MSTKKLQLLENIFPSDPQVGQVLSVDTDGNRVWSDPPAQVQADWNQNDETQTDFIKNKPKIATDEEIIALLNNVGFIDPLTDDSGNILTDESSNILLL